MKMTHLEGGIEDFFYRYSKLPLSEGSLSSASLNELQGIGQVEINTERKNFLNDKYQDTT